MKVEIESLSRIGLFVTPWPLAYQATPSMGFSRQEYWSGVPLPSESDRTERLHFHFSLSCIGEGNGNPLQCSCLENRRDGGAWWTAVYGAARSWTRLKRLSSSSSITRGRAHREIVYLRQNKAEMPT